ncbi:glycerophosphodiester phosphodiesterase [Pontibacter sp. HJ8]
MRNRILLFLFLLSCQAAQAQGRVDQIIKTMKDADSEKVMVVAHRGDWRNAPENSLLAIQLCIDMGIDMVEIDVQQTKDGHLVLMHDKTLERTTNGKGKVADWTLDSLKTLSLKNGLGRTTHHKIPTLEEAMLVAKGDILVNLDKCYDFFPQVYPVLEKTGTVHQAVMKGSHPYRKVQADFGPLLHKIFYMPIVNLDKPDAQQVIEEFQKKLKPVAFELVFATDTSRVLNSFDKIKRKGSRVWVNSLWASLNAGRDDDLAETDVEASYGWILGKGANMIQTDRLEPLVDYLRKKNRHL